MKERIHILINEDVKRDIKLMAALNNKSRSDYISDLVRKDKEEYVSKSRERSEKHRAKIQQNKK